jgi:hypothetical protein
MTRVFQLFAVLAVLSMPFMLTNPNDFVDWASNQILSIFSTHNLERLNNVSDAPMALSSQSSARHIIFLSNGYDPQKNITLEYTLRKNASVMGMPVSEELASDLAAADRGSYCDGSGCPSYKQMLISYIAEPKEDEALQQLVDFIRNQSDNPDDQARIAISMVQHIPYGEVRTDANQYPYELLYNDKGVCRDKTLLLAYILNQLGYGVALFDYNTSPAHVAIGIKCSGDDYLDTGYCFIETTSPTIITDSESIYAGGSKLPGPDKIVVISDGYEFNASEEHADAIRYEQILSLPHEELTPALYEEWRSYVDKYDLQHES